MGGGGLTEIVEHPIIQLKTGCGQAPNGQLCSLYILLLTLDLTDLRMTGSSKRKLKRLIVNWTGANHSDP